MGEPARRRPVDVVLVATGLLCLAWAVGRLAAPPRDVPGALLALGGAAVAIGVAIAHARRG